MDDDKSSMRIRLIISLLFFITSFSLSQRISFIQCPDEVVKGEKFSAIFGLYANPLDTILIVMSIEGDINPMEALSLDDSIFNLQPATNEIIEKLDLKNHLDEKFSAFVDIGNHSSTMRTYAFIFNPRSSGDFKLKLIPINLSSNLTKKETSIFENQANIKVKQNADRISGFCARFDKNGYIKFTLNESIKNGFTISFWLKTTGMRANVISMTSTIDKSFINVGIKFGRMTFTIKNSIGKFEIDVPKFISDGIWHNFIINADPIKNTLEFFIDGAKAEEIFIPNLKLFELNRPSVKIEYGQIDEIVLYRTSRPDMISKLSQYYAKFDSDVSFLLKFDDKTTTPMGNFSGLESNGVKLVESTAPIYSSAVKITAEIKSNNIVINWEVDNPSLIEKFILERKRNDEIYKQIFEIASSNQKRYSYTETLAEDNVLYYYRVKRVNKDGSYEYSDEVKIGLGLKKDFEIIGNFPNPFNAETKIIYDLFNDTYVRLTVYDIVGREIAVLVDGFQSAGRYEVTFNLNNVKNSDITSGIYLYKLQTQRGFEIRKMIAIK